MFLKSAFKIYGTLFSFFLFTGTFVAQEKGDSLLNVLANQAEDTNKVNTLNALAWEYYSTNSNLSLNYAEQAFALGKKKNFKRGMASASNSIGIAYYFKGDYPEALKNYIRASELFDEGKDKKKVSAISNNIALIFLAEGNYADAENYFLKSLVIDQELGNKLGEAQAYNNIGNIYEERANYEKALEYYFKSLAIRKKINDFEGMPSTLTNIGIAFVHTHHPAQGEQYLTESLQMYRKNKDINGIALAYNNFGDLYKEMEQYEKAISYYNKSRKISEENNYLRYLSYSYNALASTHAKTGNFVNAYNYHRMYMQIKDSIFNKENASQLTEMQTKYETEKKEKELIKSKADSEKQAVIRNAFIAGFSLMILLSIFIFRGYRNKQKLNVLITAEKEKVERQKDLIEEKQKEILDSIHYAKRIQDSLLPTEISISKNLYRLRK
jgi:tetratricopeptide (TPR) repeat protein